MASSTGHAVSQGMTDASVLAIAASDDASGYAEETSWKAGDLDPAGCAREAAEKAGRTRGATEIEAGTHAAILEPYAFSELLWYFGFSSLGALSCLEGRSYLSGRLGEKLFDEKFTLIDDGLDPEGMPKAFDLEGVPKQRVTIVEDGVAKDVVWDRRTAKRAGEGHGVHRPRSHRRPRRDSARCRSTSRCAPATSRPVSCRSGWVTAST